jgi:hypothetical protein
MGRFPMAQSAQSCSNISFCLVVASEQDEVVGEPGIQMAQIPDAASTACSRRGNPKST